MTAASMGASYSYVNALWQARADLYNLFLAHSQQGVLLVPAEVWRFPALYEASASDGRWTRKHPPTSVSRLLSKLGPRERSRNAFALGPSNAVRQRPGNALDLRPVNTLAWRHAAATPNTEGSRASQHHRRF